MLKLSKRINYSFLASVFFGTTFFSIGFSTPLCLGLGFLFLEFPLIKVFLFFFLLATLQLLFLSSRFGLFFPGILFFP